MQMNIPQAPMAQPNPGGLTKFNVAGYEVTLSNQIVREYLTGNNQSIKDDEIAMFIATCKDQGLNPFAKDAYLVKYQGGPAQIMTSIGALEKRADRFPEYDGMESGVIVVDRNGNIVKRDGAFTLPDDTLVGGWAKVYRKDRSHPTVAELSLAEYSKGQSTWKQMPAVMIRKCAKAAALREAFPQQNAGLYVKDEMPEPQEDRVVYEQPARPVRPVHQEPVESISEPMPEHAPIPEPAPAQPVNPFL